MSGTYKGIPTSTCQSINYRRFFDTSEHDSFQDMPSKILSLHLCREVHTYSIDILGIFRAWLTVKVECVISAPLESLNKCKMKAYQMCSSWFPKYSPSSISSLKSNQNWPYLISLLTVQSIENINQGCQKLQVVGISNLVVHRKKVGVWTIFIQKLLSKFIAKSLQVTSWIKHET